MRQAAIVESADNSLSGPQEQLLYLRRTQGQDDCAAI